MANKSAAFRALREVLLPLTVGLTVRGTPITVETGIGRAPMNRIQDVARKESALVCIFSRPGGGLYATGLTNASVDERKPKSLTVTLSSSSIGPGQIVTLTIALAQGFSAVQEGDAIGLGGELPLFGDGAVAIAESGDTVTDLASKLLTDIAASDLMRTWLTAESDGGVITLTGIGDKSVAIYANVSSQAFRYTSYGRATSPAQIDVWCGTEAVAEAIAEVFEGKLAQLQKDSLWLGGEGKPRERVIFQVAPPVESYDDLLKDVYRLSFLIMLDYPTTAKEEVYEVLVAFARRQDWPPPSS